MNKDLKALQLIELNEEKEAEAREYYYKLLEILPSEYHNVIYEIISDEIDHSIKLMKIAERISKIYPSEYQHLTSLKRRGD